TLLARLPSETCGLNQTELIRLFCHSVREYLGAKGVCCCRTSNHTPWSILESVGDTPWGMSGEVLPFREAESLALAQRIRKAVNCPTSSQEIDRGQGGGGSPYLAVPIFSHSDF